MKNRLRNNVPLWLLACSLALHGCGGSGGSQDLNVNDVENVNGTFDALEGLLSSINESSSSNRLSVRAQQSNAKGSLAGCHNDQEIKRMIDNLREVRVNLCAVNAMEGAGKFTVGEDGTFTYALVIFPSQPGDSQSTSSEEFQTRVRLRYYTNASGSKCLQMDRCEPNASDQFQQVHSFEACDSTDGDKKGIVARDRGAHLENDGGQRWLQVAAYGKASKGEVDLDELDIEAAFVDSWGEGKGTLTASKSANRIDMQWHNKNEYTHEGKEFSNTFNMCSVSGNSQGIVHSEGTHTGPAYPFSGKFYCPPKPGDYGQAQEVPENTNCTQPYSFSEAFSIQKNQDVASFSRVDPIESSVWYSDLKDSCAENNVEIQNFVNAWDCEATGSSFIEINVSQDQDLIESFLPCFEREDSKFEDGHRSCDERYNSGEF